MTVAYTRIDKDIVRQTISFDDITNDFKQNDMQTSIDDTQTTLDNIPSVKPYPVNATPEEKKTIDEWNIENSNKFKKENLKESIDEQKKFLDMIRAVKAMV